MKILNKYFYFRVRAINEGTGFGIEDASDADVVEVVRCKDCRWGREACGNIECSADLNLPPEYHGYEWFCPNGERRKDDER